VWGVNQGGQDANKEHKGLDRNNDFLSNRHVGKADWNLVVFQISLADLVSICVRDSTRISCLASISVVVLI